MKKHRGFRMTARPMDIQDVLRDKMTCKEPDWEYIKKVDFRQLPNDAKQYITNLPQFDGEPILSFLEDFEEWIPMWRGEKQFVVGVDWSDFDINDLPVSVRRKLRNRHFPTGVHYYAVFTSGYNYARYGTELVGYQDQAEHEARIPMNASAEEKTAGIPDADKELLLDHLRSVGPEALFSELQSTFPSSEVHRWIRDIADNAHQVDLSSPEEEFAEGAYFDKGAEGADQHFMASAKYANGRETFRVKAKDKAHAEKIAKAAVARDYEVGATEVKVVATDQAPPAGYDILADIQAHKDKLIAEYVSGIQAHADNLHYWIGDIEGFIDAAQLAMSDSPNFASVEEYYAHGRTAEDRKIHNAVTELIYNEYLNEALEQCGFDPEEYS